MKKLSSKVIATVVAVTLVLGIPITSKIITKQVKAADYELVWSDEFDGDSLNMSNWSFEVGTGSWGWGNNEKQYYTGRSQNIDISNGTLKIHALKEKYGSSNYTSARLKTQGKQSFKYGKVEARMKLPRFNGAWPAFWMLGDNISSVGWPKCGEMDIMEAINDNDNIYSNLHWSYNETQADTSGRAYNVGDRTEWHTYGMEWTENKASFYVDDHVFQTYTISTQSQMEEFRAKQFIILNLAIGGQWPESAGVGIDDSAFPDKSTMEVDYVRVYQKAEEPTTKYDGPTIVVTEDAVKKYTGTWNSFFGKDISWIDATGNFQTKATNAAGYKIDITSVGNVQNDSQWAIQGNLENLPYHAGAKYTYKCTLLADKDKRVHVKVADGMENQMAGGIVDLRANVPTYYQIDVEIPDDFDSTVSLKFGWGKMQGDDIEDYGQVNVEVKNVSFVTTTWIPDPDYTTTPGPTTTKTTTTKAPTTTSVNPTTVAPATTKSVTPSKKTTPKKVTVGKTKIKKVKRAKKSLKFKLKKIKGAAGYQVVYSDAKNFDGYWTKNVKKPKVKLKKLDRKTKYYIKARAYKKVGSIYYYGKFSKKKKAKTK